MISRLPYDQARLEVVFECEKCGASHQPPDITYVGDYRNTSGSITEREHIRLACRRCGAYEKMDTANATARDTRAKIYWDKYRASEAARKQLPTLKRWRAWWSDT